MEGPDPQADASSPRSRAARLFASPTSEEELDPRVRAAETKKRRTRAKLIQACELMMRDRGMSATVDEIAHEAGVSPPTFYNFYKSRGELCVDAFTELVVKPFETLKGTSLDAEERLEMLVKLCTGRRALLRGALIHRLEDRDTFLWNDFVHILASTLGEQLDSTVRGVGFVSMLMALNYALEEIVGGRPEVNTQAISFCLNAMTDARHMKRFTRDVRYPE